MITNLAYADVYKDVSQSHWAYEAVEFLSNLGIITGFPDGTYRGNEAATRFQVATLMYRLYYSFDNKITELNSKIEKLEARLSNQAPSKPSQQLPTTADTDNQIKILTSEINSLKASIESLSKDLKKLISDTNNLTIKSEKITSDMIENKNNLNNLKSVVDELNVKYTSLISKTVELEEKYKVLSSSTNNLQEKISSVEEVLSSSIDLLKIDIQTLKNTLEDLKIRQKQIEGTYQEILNIRQNTEMPSSSVNVQEKNFTTNYIDDIKLLNLKIEKLEDQLKYMQMLYNELSAVKSDVSELKNALERLKVNDIDVYKMDDLQEIERNINFIFEILDKLKLEIREITQSEASISTTDVKYEDKVRSLESKVIQIESLIKNLADKNNNLEMKIQDLRSKLNSILSEIKSGNEKFETSAEIEKIIEELKDSIYSSAEFVVIIKSVNQISELETKLETMNSKLKNLEKITSNINEVATKNDIEELRMELETLREVFSQLKFVQVDGSISELLKSVEEKNNKISELSQYTQNLSKRLDSVDDKVNKLMAETSKVAQTTVLTSMEIDITDLKNRIKKLEEEVQKRATTSQLNSVNQNVQKVLSMTIDLEKQLKAIIDGSQTGVSKDFENNLNNLQKDQKTILENLENLRIFVDSLKTTVDSLEKRVALLSSENDSMKKQIESIDKPDKITYISDSELVKNVAKLEDDFKALSQKVDELVSLVSSIKSQNTEELNKKLHDIENTFGERTQKLSDDIANLAKVIKVLDESTNTLYTLYESIYKSFEEYNVNVQKLSVSDMEFSDELNLVKDYCIALENRISNLEGEIDNLISNLDSISEKLLYLEDTMKQLNGRMTSFESEIIDIRNSMVKTEKLPDLVDEILQIKFKDVERAIDEKIENRYSKIGEENNILLKNFQEDLATKIMLSETKMYSLTKDLEKAINKLSEVQEGHGKAISDINDKMENLSKDIRDIDLKFSDFLKSYSEESSTTTNSIKALEEKTKNLEEELQKAKQERSQMQNTQNFLILLSIASVIIALIAVFK